MLLLHSLVARRPLAPLATVLIDGNHAFRRVAVRLFAQYFPERIALIATFASFGEAVAAPEPGLRAAQLMLLGLGGEGLAGTTGLAALRAGHPELIIVVLLHLDTSLYRQLLLSAGADMVVAKEQIATELLPAIEQALGLRSPRL